ncbi:hypothetical protein SDC9_98833 [bioreactor metagenome]|uniref:Uncharacterized protein n=1 Tax=bioreactor metagenome TaxID=1076179 RepID=A0A645AFW7_9ZZZZ
MDHGGEGDRTERVLCHLRFSPCLEITLGGGIDDIPYPGGTVVIVEVIEIGTVFGLDVPLKKGDESELGFS